MSSTSSKYPWEEEYQWLDASLYDDEDAAAGSDIEEEFDYDNVEPEVAQACLFDYVVALKNDGTISAKTACVIAFWATKSGSLGQIGSLAFAPNKASSGAYSKHFDRVVAPANDSLYRMKAQCQMRADASTVVKEIPVVLPHEAFVQEVEAHPELLQMAVEDRDHNVLPHSFYEHPVVQGAPGDLPVLPAAMFVDGVPFARHDGLLGVWAYLVHSGKRVLIATLRKSEMCSCGCRNWCTILPLMTLLRWSFQALADNLYPSRRHDGSQWDDLRDGERSVLAGEPLGFKVALVMIKCDIAEYGTSLGLPGCSSSRHPCPLCVLPTASLPGLRHFSALGNDAAKSFNVYSEACDRCEFLVDVTDENYHLLRAALRPDKRAGPESSRGWALVHAVEELGLERGDRLEPSPDMLMVTSFFTQPRPFQAKFWRRSLETAARHRNPLFSASLGVTPLTVIGVDSLHTVALGVCKYWSSRAAHALIDGNAFGVQRASDAVRFETSVASLRSLLFAWYETEAAAGRKGHTRVQDLTPSMIGPSYHHTLGLHGAECVAFTKFMAGLVQSKRNFLEPALGESLIGAGTSLCEVLRLIGVMGHSPRVDAGDAEAARIWGANKFRKEAATIFRDYPRDLKTFNVYC